VQHLRRKRIRTLAKASHQTQQRPLTRIKARDLGFLACLHRHPRRNRRQRLADALQRGF